MGRRHSAERTLIFILLAGLIFSACSTRYTMPEREDAVILRTPPEGVPQIGAKTVSHPTQSPSPSSSLLIVARLTESAEGHLKAGNLDRAFATAERAVRIDASNPRLWNLLARVQLRRGNVRQAEQLARKSNLLAKRDASLQAENWRIIAKALRKKGAAEAAEDAEFKAKAFDAYD